VHLKNYHDTEDVFQDVFLKYIQHDTEFINDEHEKAWIIRVTINACKDSLKSYFRRNSVSLNEACELPEREQADHSDVLEAVLKLPVKYKNLIYLCYFEGYSAIEAAALLNKNVNTVYTWIARAKSLLKESLGGDPFAE
jgi:RNA polymerase sigma-70 factor (ECF subfamily)